MADFYCRSALVLDDLMAKRGSLKSYVAQGHCLRIPTNLSSLATRHARQNDGRRLLALCSQTLKCECWAMESQSDSDSWAKDKTALLEIIAKAQLEKETTLLLRGLTEASSGSIKGKEKVPHYPKPSAASLLLVLLHDLLFSARGIALPKDHKLRKGLESHLLRIKSEKERLKVRRRVKTDAELAEGDITTSEEVSKTRWMRVNSILWSLDDALAWLHEHGWTGVAPGSELTEQHHFHQDQHLNTLLAFPASLQLTKFEPYLDGRLISQDKASCLPPFVLVENLSEEELSNLIAVDATAAPGNKTSFLSALIGEGKTGKLYAFEQDKQRFKTLQTMLKKAKAQNVETRCADFLRIKASDVGGATHILVDPSCSGSGIPNRPDYSTEVDAGRLRALSEFQVAILSHAMRLSSATTVSYSTCSIHEQENEHVIARVLGKPEFSEWTLQEALPSWPRRGLVCEGVSPEQAKCMIRCLPEDGTNHGFFVAVLTREEEWQGIPDA